MSVGRSRGFLQRLGKRRNRALPSVDEVVEIPGKLAGEGLDGVVPDAAEELPVAQLVYLAGLDQIYRWNPRREAGSSRSSTA